MELASSKQSTKELDSIPSSVEVSCCTEESMEVFGGGGLRSKERDGPSGAHTTSSLTGAMIVGMYLWLCLDPSASNQ